MSEKYLNIKKYYLDGIAKRCHFFLLCVITKNLCMYAPSAYSDSTIVNIIYFVIQN